MRRERGIGTFAISSRQVGRFTAYEVCPPEIFDGVPALGHGAEHRAHDREKRRPPVIKRARRIAGRAERWCWGCEAGGPQWGRLTVHGLLCRENCGECGAEGGAELAAAVVHGMFVERAWLRAKEFRWGAQDRRWNGRDCPIISALPLGKPQIAIPITG